MSSKDNVTFGRDDEQRYLRLVESVIAQGATRIDRTNTGTLSVFAPDPLRFDLRNSTLPLLTTKRMYYKGIMEELLWFLRGSTDATKLAARGVHIWDANASRSFLDARGLSSLREGDIGAGYGHQWRHFGAKYRGCDADYTGEGVDQLKYIVEMIRTEPTSRRIFMSAWNPLALSQMALPPCHISVQFYVDPVKKELSAHMYQRSADLGLGVPYNIASYALLTHMLAHVCKLKARALTISMGDAHVYTNHVDALRVQLQRQPRAFPTLRFATLRSRLDDFVAADVLVENYKPHPRIAMSMAV